MLLTIYEEDNSAKFKAKFTTPVTLPKNSSITLLKAYIPRDKKITIDATNNEITLLAHTTTGNANAMVHIPLLDGVYGLVAFAEMVESAYQNAKANEALTNNGQLLATRFDVVIEGGNGDADSVELKLICDSVSANYYMEGGLTDANTTIIPNVKKQIPNNVVTLANSNNAIKLNNYTTVTPTPKSGWNWIASYPTALDRLRFSPNQHYNASSDLLPVGNGKYMTVVTAKVGYALNNASFIGVRPTGGALQTSGTPTSLSTLDELTGVDCIIAHYGTTANGKTAGNIEIFEMIAGTFQSVHMTTSNDYLDDTQMYIQIPSNINAGTDHNRYWAKRFGETEPEMINIVSPQRLVPSSAEVYHFVFGIFAGVDTTGDDAPQLTDIKMGMDAGYSLADVGGATTSRGLGYLDNFGQHNSVIIGGANNNNKDLKTTMGYDADAYTTGGIPADRTEAVRLIQKNTLPMVLNDDQQPFLNLNINNLPINSISCSHANSSDIAVGETQHGISRCVASMPRYNSDGSYDNDCVMFDDNTQSLELLNSEELILSELDCRLQNCDGTYPTDLLTPSSFLFKISGDKLN